MSATPCPACGSEKFDQLIDFGSVPRSGIFPPSAAAKVPYIDLAFDFCTACALLCQRPRAEETCDYTNIARSTTRQLPAYATHLARSIVHGVNDKSGLVIEVGSNDGAFLTLLLESGLSNVVGIEPSQACATASIAKGHSVEITHLDLQSAQAFHDKYGPAAAVICRHTLEHVPDPAAFLTAIHTLLAPRGLLFIEVPNAEAIIDDLRGHELWDEHLNIFTPENLALAIARTGFEVSEPSVWPHCGTTNVLVWAHRAESFPSPLKPPAASAIDTDSCRQFLRRWDGYKNGIARAVESCPGSLIAIGASHPQTNFLLFTGQGSAISAMVDDDPEKKGRFACAPSLIPVVSSSQFHAAPPPGGVIRTAFGYEDWMDGLLAPFVSSQLIVIRPYSPPFLAGVYS